MTYIPLARKYRPQTFKDLVGQSHVTTTLTRALESGRIGQAYVFAGQRGVGKTSAARILAKCLNCAKGPTASPCQKCSSCLAIVQGASLDVIEIDGASNRGIEEIRTLRETVKFAPTQGKYRVYIIDEVHMLTPEAFNALLKTLEEPPAHVRFIFATTAPQKLPPTILSRCQRFDFRRLDGNTIAATLRPIGKAEKISIDDAALFAIARASEGSLRDAEVIFEQLASFAGGPIRESDVSQLLGALEQDALLAWTQGLADRDANAALHFLAQQLEQGKDLTQLLIALLTHLRNLLILRTTTDAPGRPKLLERLLDVPADDLARLEQQAGRFTPEELLMMGQILTGAYDLMRRSPFGQAILELALIKLASRDAWTSLPQMIQRLEQMSQGGGPAASAPEPAAVRPTPVQMSVAQDPPGGSPVDSAASEELIASWPRFLECLGRRKMSVAAYLMEARPLGLEGACLQVGLPGFALHQEVLSRTDAIRLVEDVLAETFGRSLTVAYTTLPEPPPAPAAQSRQPAPPAREPLPTIVQDIVSLFDATIIKPPAAHP